MEEKKKRPSKGMRKYIRLKKAEIRRDVVEPEKQKEEINALLESVTKE